MTQWGCSLAMTPLSVIARAQPEAISSLHIPVGVRRFEGIASLTAFARNDGVGLQARNGAIGLFARNGVTKTLLIVIQSLPIIKKAVEINYKMF